MKNYSSVVIVIIVLSITHLVRFLIMWVIYQSLKTPPDLQKHTCVNDDKISSLGGSSDKKSPLFNEERDK